MTKAAQPFNLDVSTQITNELGVKPQQVEAAIQLLDEGATVPFIARYRKEATQGLDDQQLRHVQQRLGYLRDLNERRGKALESIRQQGRLTEDLQERINLAETKTALEELYAPYRPKKTSKSSLAREAGLEPAALRILQEDVSPEETLSGFTHENYPDIAAQLDGLTHIIIDEWAKDVGLLAQLKQNFKPGAVLHSRLAGEDKREVGKKFSDYFDASENLVKMANHRLLALLRGRQENVLALKVEGDNQTPIATLKTYFGLNEIQNESRKTFLNDAAELLWNGKWRPHIEHTLLTDKRLDAESEAIKVFADNLRHLLLAAPAGGKRTLGLDPGIRHGVKMAVVDDKGHVLETSTVYPFEPKNEREAARAEIARLCEAYQIELVSIGNGTASRETDALVAELQQEKPELALTRVLVNEAGASVYSASELASQELADLDVAVRGAVSIARRLQDPLAELVKIDPKSIGVGQYQHDVNQTQLASMLDAVVEDCVNAVGVDVNTASPALLARIAGLNNNVAQQIVEYRQINGRFVNREQLKQVPRLGQRTFEQAAGFLRIHDGDQPLDASAVHPEAYSLVNQIVVDTKQALTDVMGKAEIFAGMDLNQWVSDQFGLPTITDILKELEKPGRDPRPEFKTAKFRDDIHSISDLTENMILEGVITNVANFGAFVDIGVHQDGLVHISELSNQYVSDPQKLVKPGQIVKVRVIGIDKDRNRISLSFKLDPTESQSPRTKVEAVNRQGDMKNRPPRQSTKDKSTNRSTRPTTASPRNSSREKASAAAPTKIGTFGALLQQAGVKADSKNEKK